MMHIQSYGTFFQLLVPIEKTSFLSTRKIQYNTQYSTSRLKILYYFCPLNIENSLVSIKYAFPMHVDNFRRLTMYTCIVKIYIQYMYCHNIRVDIY